MLCFADRSTSPDLDEPSVGAEDSREDEPSIAEVARAALIGAGLRVSSAAPELGSVMLVPNQEPDRAADGVIVGFATREDCERAWLALEGAGLAVPAIGPVWIEVAWPGDVLKDEPLVDALAREAA